MRVAKQRRVSGFLPWLGLALALAACGKQETAPVTVNIAASMASADQRPPPGTLEFARAGDLRYLVSGWYPPRRREDGAGFEVWTRGPVALLELPEDRTDGMRIELTLRPLPEPIDAAPAPRQWVTLRLGTHTLGRFAVRPPSTRVRVTLAGEIEHPGVHSLALLPHWFGDMSEDARAHREPRRGLRLESAHFERPRPGRTSSAGVRSDGDDLLQQIDSRFGTTLRLPTAARLRGRVRSLAAERRGDGPGRVRIGLATDGEPWKELLSADFEALHRGQEIDVDLSAWAGRAVELDFIVEKRSPIRSESPGVVRWIAPRVEGRVPARAAAPPPAATRPNLLVILFDTLRADFTEPYDHAGLRAATTPPLTTPPSTPNMQRLAERGVTFLGASANAASTRSSTASLMTGLLPDAHTVTRFTSTLPESVPTLASSLAQAGYLTVGVSNNAHVSTQSGADRGFDHFGALYEEPESVLRAQYPTAEARAAHVWERYVAPALDTRGDSPFFVYVHEIDPHFPYDPLPPFDGLQDFPGSSALAADPHLRLDGAAGFAQVTRLIRRLNRVGAGLAEGDLRSLRDRYAGEVAYVDALLGHWMQRLAAQGLDQDTVVVLVSDHGEQFLEHGIWTHGRTLYREDIRVPFVLALPDGSAAGQRIDADAQLIDLAPTLLELAGVPAPASMQGRSLWPSLFGKLPPRPAFARGDYIMEAPAWSRRSMIRDGRWKLHRTRSVYPDGEVELFELYDLERDPAEQTDLSAAHPVTARWLRQRLAAQDAMDAALAPQAVETPTDAATEERLRALGYIE